MIRYTFLFIAFMIVACSSEEVNFKPERIHKAATFSVRARVEKAFPLFGPVREKEWAAGWEPEIVFSNSSEAEEHMIFKTSGKHHGEEYLWVITQFKPDEYLIEYTVSTADRIWFIRVQCKAAGENTETTVSYTYTGLNSKGNAQNREALEKMFAHNLKDWEEAINHYIQTGEQLK
jgi:hypothetical protein